MAQEKLTLKKKDEKLSWILTKEEYNKNVEIKFSAHEAFLE